MTLGNLIVIREPRHSLPLPSVVNDVVLCL